MKWINLHHLKYFLIIAEEGSLSAASKKLLIGQPALSAQLKQFETNLGLKLFFRQGKRLVISPAGEYVFRYAKAIWDLEEELSSNLHHADSMIQDELVLGAQESVPKSILAETIRKISGLRSIKLKVLEGTGEILFEQLLNGKIDFFVGNFKPLSETKEMIFTSIDAEPVSVWGPKKYVNLKKNFPKSLEGAPFILPGFQNPIRHEFENFMLKRGHNFILKVEAQDTALQKELSAKGEGLIVIGDHSAQAWVEAGRLVKIGSLKGIREEYWLGMVKKRIDNSYLKMIVDVF